MFRQAIRSVRLQSTQQFAKSKQPIKKPQVAQVQKQENLVKETPKAEPVVMTQATESKPQTNLHQKATHMEYKAYPTHISHNNPASKDYVHSERDEYKQNILVDEYNTTIQNLKKDLHMQQQVYDVLEKMDRPYKKGVPGNTRTISAGLQDYGIPENLGFKVPRAEYENEYLEEHLTNKDRWISNSPFHQKYDKMSNEVVHEKELAARPTNDHFHPDKGSKYDVEVPRTEKYPFLADRLGHPEILGTPFERLMRLESDIYHPACLNQPFVQIPKADPIKDLSFEEGEIIYENNQLQEWAKFLKLSGTGLYAWFVMFVPYQLIMKTHMPLSDSYNNIFLNYYQHSYYNFDSNNLHIPVVAGILTYSSYYFFKASDRAMKDYVVRLQYSKDKELLFVTRVSPYGATEEEVYELAHLEVLPPSVKSALPHLSSQDDDGLWDVTCMNTQTNLVVSNEDKYWAPGHRKDFLNRVTGLWQEYNTPVSQDISLQK